MTGWSSKPEWPSVTDTAAMEEVAAHGWPEKSEGAKIAEAEMANAVKTYTMREIKIYNNKMPTHNPYTNPNAQLYYECKCGAILDPGTKSFAALNNAASDQGWKVRWKPNGEGYEPFCVECGKDVE